MCDKGKLRVIEGRKATDPDVSLEIRAAGLPKPQRCFLCFGFFTELKSGLRSDLKKAKPGKPGDAKL